MIRIRTAAVSVAAIAAIGGLSACKSSGSSGATDAATNPPVTSSAAGSVTPAAAGATSTVTATETEGTTTTANADSSGGNGSSGGSSSRCAESQLRANAVSDDIKGLNRHVVKLTFTNKSSSSCTLTGYPGAAIEDSSNKQVQQATRIVGGPVGGTIEKSATITVAAGSTAYAYLEGSSTREQGAAQAGCDASKYPRILVTPPNTSTPVPFTIGWPQCYTFDVHPVRIDS